MQALRHGPVVRCLVVGQGPETLRWQILLGLRDQLGEAFIVAGLGVAAAINQRHFVLDIDQEVQLVAEPFDDLGDHAVVVPVLLASDQATILHLREGRRPGSRAANREKARLLNHATGSSGADRTCPGGEEGVEFSHPSQDGNHWGLV